MGKYKTIFNYVTTTFSEEVKSSPLVLAFLRLLREAPDTEQAQLEVSTKHVGNISHPRINVYFNVADREAPERRCKQYLTYLRELGINVDLSECAKAIGIHDDGFYYSFFGFDIRENLKTSKVKIYLRLKQPMQMDQILFNGVKRCVSLICFEFGIDGSFVVKPYLNWRWPGTDLSKVQLAEVVANQKIQDLLNGSGFCDIAVAFKGEKGAYIYAHHDEDGLPEILRKELGIDPTPLVIDGITYLPEAFGAYSEDVASGNFSEYNLYYFV